MLGHPAVGPASEPQRPDERLEERAGRANERRQAGAQDRERVRLEEIPGLRELLRVAGVDRGRLVAPDRDACHLDALLLQGQDLAPDEGVADLRVLIDQIGDANSRRRTKPRDSGRRCS